MKVKGLALGCLAVVLLSQGALAELSRVGVRGNQFVTADAHQGLEFCTDATGCLF